jgi:hypothetical protein
MITTVSNLKIGDRISYIGSDRIGYVKKLKRCKDVLTIVEMELTSTRDFEGINPWLPPEPTVLCYKMMLFNEKFPRNVLDNPWVHRYTLDYLFYKHKRCANGH